MRLTLQKPTLLNVCPGRVCFDQLSFDQLCNTSAMRGQMGFDRQGNEACSTQECSWCHARTGLKGLVVSDVRYVSAMRVPSEQDRNVNTPPQIIQDHVRVAFE